MYLPKLDPVLIRISAMGMELGLAVVFGLVSGKFVDDWLGTSPVFLIFLGLCGIIAGYRSLWRMRKLVQERSQSKPESESDQTHDRN